MKMNQLGLAESLSQSLANKLHRRQLFHATTTTMTGTADLPVHFLRAC